MPADISLPMVVKVFTLPRMSTTQVTSASDALNALVTASLNAITLGGSTNWQQTGGAGGTVVYPQGSTTNASSFYYPTFASFDRQVTLNDAGFTVSNGKLTTYLSGLYQTLAYAESAQQQAQDTQNINNVGADINSYFINQWAPAFLGTWDESSQTVNTALTGYSMYQSQPWAKQALTAWQSYNENGSLPVSSDTILGYIQSSLFFQASTANRNKSIAVKPKYQNQSSSQLYNALISGGQQFSNIYTPQLTTANTTPWTNTLYAGFNQLLVESGNASKNAVSAQYNNLLINGALSYLQAYTGNTTADTSNLQSNSTAYTPVYAGTSNTANASYPQFLPNAEYTISPSLVAQYALPGNGSAIELTVDQSSGTSTTFSSSASQEASYNATQFSNWGFMGESMNTSGSEGTSVSFSSYDENATTTGGSIRFDNIGYQTWSPSQTGSSMWLLADQIANAIDAKTSTTPYIYSPNFQGGYGFTSSNAAAEYAGSGFAYLNSIGYSFNPVTVVSGSTSAATGEAWSANEFAKASYSQAAGFSLGAWMGSGESTNVSGGTSNSQASSTYDASTNTFTVTSNPIPQPVTESDFGGLPALEIGAVITTIAEPNTNFSQQNSSSLMQADPSTINVSTPWVYSKDSFAASLDETDNIGFGSKESDYIHGQGGNDELFGHNGHDILTGGKGRDFLSGGLGKNTLRPGHGRDYIEFDREIVSSGKSHDLIYGFNSGDTLWFTHGVDPSHISVSNNKLYYDGNKFATFKGLENSVLVEALNGATFI